MKKLLPLFLLLPSFTFAQSTGFLAPTATAAPNGGWNNPASAFVSDDVYTDVPHQSGCRCPFLYLSWDNGVSYTSANIVGPFGTSDNSMTAGNSTDLWGHAWVETEFTNANFRLKIANPSTLIEQGYGDFNFNIPAGSTITGIEVLVEEHGDSAYTTEYIDVIQVNVHYTIGTSVNTSLATSEIQAYPNPASSILVVDHLSPNTERIALFDVTGKQMMEDINPNAAQVTLNVGELPRGMYLLVVTDPEAGMVTRKIVLE